MCKIWTNYNEILNTANLYYPFDQQIKEIKENKEKWFNVKTLIMKLKEDVESLINWDKHYVMKN